MKSNFSIFAICISGLVGVAAPANASSLLFDTGNPDGLMATASRPQSAGKFEIESGDDFVLTSSTSIASAAFTGLIPLGASIADVKSVTVEIYRVFPSDSELGRTSGPPTFSTPNVPTRVNSPSDVAFKFAGSVGGTLSFSGTVLQSSFTANNSVGPGGIHPMPNVFTGGNGAVTGQETMFNVNFITPLVLPADHYFFVPQVELANGDFFWLSAPRPIVPPGTPFPPGFTDLQSWTRDDSTGGIEPDWLRIGTDITHQGPFNASFSLTGDPATPLPSALPLFATGLGVLGLFGLRRRRKAQAVA